MSGHSIILISFSIIKSLTDALIILLVILSMLSFSRLLSVGVWTFLTVIKPIGTFAVFLVKLLTNKINILFDFNLNLFTLDVI